jgi:acyl-coenzyme A thioesterase 13
MDPSPAWGIDNNVAKVESRNEITTLKPQDPDPLNQRLAHGFGPIFRTSPLLDALGGFMSKGDGNDLQIGLLVGQKHLNARGSLHGGVIATLVDVAFGYMIVARDGGRRQLTASVKVDYRSSAGLNEWLEAFIEQVERDGRKTKVTGRIVSGERVIVEASVLFVQAA